MKKLSSINLIIIILSLFFSAGIFGGRNASGEVYPSELDEAIEQVLKQLSIKEIIMLENTPEYLLDTYRSKELRSVLSKSLNIYANKELQANLSADRWNIRDVMIKAIWNELRVRNKRDLDDKHVDIYIDDRNDTIFVRIGTKKYLINKYAINKFPLDGPAPLAKFTIPNNYFMSMFRPEVKWYSNPESKINAVFVKDNVIWLGFSFYAGEGLSGYGGIGFFDTKNNDVGVLRHPALIKCSVNKLQVHDNKIYVLTESRREWSDSVCNGLVIIDMVSLDVTTMVPKETNVLKDRDSGFLNDEYYTLSVLKMASDKRFRKRNIETWNEQKKEAIRKKGLIKYMIQTAKKEQDIRNKAISNAKLLIDDTVVLNVNDSAMSTDGVISVPNEGAIEFDGGYTMLVPISVNKDKCLIEGMRDAGINFRSLDSYRNKYPSVLPHGTSRKSGYGSKWVYAEKGVKWVHESTEHIFIVTLEDFELADLVCPPGDRSVQDVDPLFKSISFRGKIMKLTYE